MTDEGRASLKARSMMLCRCEAQIGGGVAPPIQFGWRSVDEDGTGVGRGTAGGVARGMPAAAGARGNRLRSRLGVLDSVLGAQAAGLVGRMEDSRESQGGRWGSQGCTD